MRKGHFPRDCKSKHVCKLCKQRHHSLIHRDQSFVKNDPAPSASATDKQSSNTSTVEAEEPVRVKVRSVASNSFSHQSINTTLLPTALILLKGSSGRSVRVRALLDQGSQASFVSESVAQLIKANRGPASIEVSGVGGTYAGTVKTVATFTVEPCSRNGLVLPLTALVLAKLTTYTPMPFSISHNLEFNALILADPEPSSRKKIDLLIGANYFGTTLLDGLIRGPSGGLTAQHTIFGWIVSGPVNNSNQAEAKYHINVNYVAVLDPLNEALRKFWEIEKVPRPTLLSDEELQCESHFTNTHSRQSDGRYIVRLPFKTCTPIPIDETEQVARRIFLSNENRLARQPDLAKAYIEFMHE